MKHLRSGADETDSFEAETTIPGGGRIGFGVGSEADFRFDDVGTRQDVTLTASTALRYHYDANGRVVGRTLDPEGTPESQFFIYDGDRIIQELDEGGNLVAAWDYGIYIDELLVMYRDVEAPAGLEPYYYLQDDHYNVIGLTDANGTVVERYAYDDYGAPTIYTGDGSATRTESDYGNPFLFQGRRWDEVLSLYDYRTRYYDPAIGRFLRIDTIGLWGDANNLGNPYAFVGNNPWTHLDPYGEWAWDGDWIEYGVGGLLGLQGREVFVVGFSEAHTDAAKGVKGMVWTGPKNAVVGVATVVAHPIQTAQGARDFASAAYNDFGGTASAIGDSIAAAATNPESIGAFSFDIMASVATGGAAKSGSVGKLTTMVKRIDWADNRGMGRVAGGVDKASSTRLVIEEYGTLSKNVDVLGQAHHLNQDAAFSSVIPTKRGISIKLEGDAFVDIGTPHYSAHANLEMFWNQFRRGGARAGIVPTNLEYSKALADSLRAAELSPGQVRQAVRASIRQRVGIGQLGGHEIPRVPGRLNQRK